MYERLEAMWSTLTVAQKVSLFTLGEVLANKNVAGDEAVVDNSMLMLSQLDRGDDVDSTFLRPNVQLFLEELLVREGHIGFRSVYRRLMSEL